uniref:Putative MAT1-2-1 protein n=1 Tax=Teratosphaeria gauchensis TaxID=405846 RepID=A0A5C0PVM8_9PEZI|nr:putative MAT1-2-1 protein [Teratosphaeria gauchensis]
MAVQHTTSQPNLPSASAGQLLGSYAEAFEGIKEQLRNGVGLPVIPLTKITILGADGIEVLKRHIENSTRSRFGISVDASANAVTLMPLGPMPEKPAVPAPKNAGSKVPRPPNAFIIYRKEWHPKVVAENPGLHNNAISVIIGDKWRAESDEVREEYKRKAEDAKRQHELDHPGYQYQPRKPSEKKKRMTKNKLAKLAAKAQENNGDGISVQQPLPDDFDPIAMLDENLRQCMGNNPLQVTQFGTEYSTQPPTLNATTVPGLMSFDAAHDSDAMLRTQLEEFNMLHHSLPQPNPNPAGNGQPVGISQSFRNPAVVCQPVVNGGFVDDARRFDLPARTVDTSAVFDEISAPGAATTSTDAMVYDPMAEVERQNLLEIDFDQFIDLHGNNSPSPNNGGTGNEGFTYAFDGAGNAPFNMDGDSDSFYLTDGAAFDLDFVGNTSGQ